MALVVITGGVRSGKSSAAQRLAETLQAEGRNVAVAVFARPSHDAEMAERIRLHQESRPAGFRTLEATVSPEHWLDEVAPDDVLLVDCLGTMLGLSMELAYEESRGNQDFADADRSRLPDGYEQRVRTLFETQVSAIAQRVGDTIVVTNEVGWSLVPETASGRFFGDLLGQQNRTLVNTADAAFLAVCGRLLDLSTLPTHAEWPED